MNPFNASFHQKILVSSALLTIFMPLPEATAAVQDASESVDTAISYDFHLPNFLQQGEFKDPTGAIPIAESVSVPGVSATATTTFQPFPELMGTTSVVGTLGGAEVDSSLIYYFEVVGPPNSAVPIDIATSGAITSPVAEGAVNYSTIQYNLTPVVGICQAGKNTLCSNALLYTKSFSYDLKETTAANTQDSIALALSLRSNTVYDGEGADEQSGDIDPVVSIDPTFPEASEYHIEFSPGVGNNVTSVNAAVPELSTWAMMLLGLAGLGFLRISAAAEAEVGRD